MLNMLYGWCNSRQQQSPNQQAIEQLIDNRYSISSQKTLSDFCGSAVYSRYKSASITSSNNCILSIIGDVFLKQGNYTRISSEDLIKLYIKHGSSFSNKIKGQFILSLLDNRDKRLIIVNDTMATFPLYYSLNQDGHFIYSNHLKLLTDNSEIHINHQAIYNYIYFHMIPSPDTIFKNIYKLEPNQILQYKDGNYSIQNGSTPEFDETNTESKEDLAKSIFDTLDRSVKEHIKAPDKTGCFLSGGLDSSAVAGFLAKNSPGKAKTFSIGFPVKEYNEIDYARIASKKFKTEQHEYFIQPEDVHTILDDIVSSMDEPFGNSSVIPVYYCAKLAKQNGVDHLLAGDGGDEIFAGNTRYAKQQVFESYFKLPAFVRKRLIEPLSRNNIFTSNFIGRKVKSYVNQANIPLPDRLETYNFLHLHSPESVFTSDFLNTISPDEPITLIRKTYQRPKDISTLNRMLFLDWKHTLADNDLRKVNSMCEHAGIDVSYPMLSSEMIELSCKIPSKLKLSPGRLRYLYKKAMQDFLPDSIINKPKHGFGLPFGVWTKTDKDLQKIAYNTLESLKAYNIFNEQFLKETIENHQEVHAAFYGELIWILMILGLWLNKNMPERT